MYDLSGSIPADERPVVFIGPYEHHSNEISWRETIADVVVIDEDRDGRIDESAPRSRADRVPRPAPQDRQFLGRIERDGHRLEHHLGDVVAAQTRALAFWDFAAAAPYVAIDMNPGER